MYTPDASTAPLAAPPARTSQAEETVLEIVVSLNAQTFATSQQSACHAIVGLADTTCDSGTPKPKPGVQIMAVGVAHGPPPDDDSPSPEPRPSPYADGPIELFGALPRPPEKAEGTLARWADVDIGEGIGSNVSTADGTDPCDTKSICSASSHGSSREDSSQASQLRSLW